MPRGSEQAKELARVEAIVAQNKYNRIIAEAAREFPGLDPGVLKSLLIQENNFNPHPPQSGSFVGIAQMNPVAAAEGDVNTSNKVDERTNPEKAIPGAARILAKKAEYLENTFQAYGRPTGDDYMKFVLASYNAGQGTIAEAMRLAYETGLEKAKQKGLTKDEALH